MNTWQIYVLNKWTELHLHIHIPRFWCSKWCVHISLDLCVKICLSVTFFPCHSCKYKMKAPWKIDHQVKNVSLAYRQMPACAPLVLIPSLTRECVEVCSITHFSFSNLTFWVAICPLWNNCTNWKLGNGKHARPLVVVFQTSSPLLDVVEKVQYICAGIACKHGKYCSLQHRKMIRCTEHGIF